LVKGLHLAGFKINALDPCPGIVGGNAPRVAPFKPAIVDAVELAVWTQGQAIWTAADLGDRLLAAIG
jgi:hypothetical protein